MEYLGNKMFRIFLFLFLIFSPLHAFPENITILADNATWNRKEEITTLTGNVLITKGSISISATTMKVIGKLERLNEVIGEGNVKIIDKEKDIHLSGGYITYSKPTEYICITNKPKLELKKEDLVITAMKMEGFYKQGEFIATDLVEMIHQDTRATASKAIYFEKKKRLELIGNAFIIQGDNKIEGKKIVYYLQEDRFEIIEGVKAILMRK